MGGTKACVIQDGKAGLVPLWKWRVHRFKKRSGLPIRIPVVGMIEIGAGGGSIAAYAAPPSHAVTNFCE